MPERIIPTNKDWWPEYGWEHLQRYAFAARYCRDGYGIDFGCGVGYGTEILARAGATGVIGIDIDPDAIEAARCRSVPSNASFCVDLEEASALRPGGYDFGVMFEVIEHLPNPIKSLKDIAAQLREGAFFIVSAPNRRQFSGAENPITNEYHLNEPTYEQLFRWLEPSFEILEEFEQSELHLRGQEYAIATLQKSWMLRGERWIRRIIGRPLELPVKHNLLRKTDIFPLIIERRDLCQQFLFVCKKR